jgi:hypothetical protein
MDGTTLKPPKKTIYVTISTPTTTNFNHECYIIMGFVGKTMRSLET